MNATTQNGTGMATPASSRSPRHDTLRSDLLTLEQIHPTIQEARQEAFHQHAKKTLARLRADKFAKQNRAIGMKALWAMIGLVIAGALALALGLGK